MPDDFLGIVRRLAAAADTDLRLQRLGRHCTTTFYLAASDADGESGAYLEVSAGRLTGVEPGPRHLRSARFAIRAAPEAWREFWSAQPRPGYQDIFALARFGHARIDGDLDPLLTHLPYFKRLLALPRPQPASSACT